MAGRISAPTEKALRSRDEAKSLGLTRYFTGAPCNRGHIAERFVSIRHCVECRAEEKRRAYARNPAKAQARARRWQTKNHETLREKQKAYRATHKDQKTRTNRAWLAANPHKALEYYRRNKYGITNEQFDAMLAAQGHQCAICGKTQQRGWHIDHCHSTGRVRGILCHGCNIGLGAFRDRTTSLLKAIQYLERNNVG